MGAVIDANAYKTITDYIEIGKQEGGKLLIGGNPLTGGDYKKGWFFEPTIFADVEPDMRIAQEEIFGPVLSVIDASGLDEAIRIMNGTRYGLSSSIYTRDVNKAFKAIRDIEAGITYINAPTIGAEVHLPFGGVKDTGFTREAGSAAVDEFTYEKAVYIDYSGKLQKAQIDTEKS